MKNAGGPQKKTVLSPRTLGILLTKEFSAGQKANLKLL